MSAGHSEGVGNGEPAPSSNKQAEIQVRDLASSGCYYITIDPRPDNSIFSVAPVCN